MLSSGRIFFIVMASRSLVFTSSFSLAMMLTLTRAVPLPQASRWSWTVEPRPLTACSRIRSCRGLVVEPTYLWPQGVQVTWYSQFVMNHWPACLVGQSFQMQRLASRCLGRTTSTMVLDLLYGRMPSRVKAIRIRYSAATLRYGRSM